DLHDFQASDQAALISMAHIPGSDWTQSSQTYQIYPAGTPFKLFISARPGADTSRLQGAQISFRTTAPDTPTFMFKVAGFLPGETPGTNLIKNGDFEQGVPVPGAYVSLQAGSTDITDWIVSRGAIDYNSPVQWDAAKGSRSLDLNYLDIGGVKQTFATTPGATYTVRFALAGNPQGPPTTKTMRVEVTPSSPPQYADFSVSVAGRAYRNMG